MSSPEQPVRPRPLLYFETFVVVGLLAIPATLRAIFQFLNPQFVHPLAEHPDWAFFSMAVEELLLIALAWLAMRLNGERLEDFTMPLQKNDLVLGLALAVLSIGASFAAAAAAAVLFPSLTVNSDAAGWEKGFRVPLSPAYFALLVINPHCEEFIIRGYLQTRLRQAEWPAAAVVVASVLIQSLYHLYQGVFAVLMHVGGFLVFAGYYQRTRRLWPVVVAHLAMDLYAGLSLSRGA